MLIAADGGVHAGMRSIVNRGFTPRRVADWEPRVSAIVERCMARLHAGEPGACARGPPPGEVIDAGPAGIDVACGTGAYRITRLQRPGGKPLEADAFLRGFELPAGTRLGP